MHAVDGILGRFVPAIPVDISEFKSDHIEFDYDRYCKPFITDEILAATCNGHADYIKEHFLEASSNEQYRLKNEFSTQRKVAQYFQQNSVEEKDKIKQCLFDLISNVIFLEEENSGGQKFHFRIAMQNTSSFEQLEIPVKERLSELYINYFYQRQDDFWRKEALKKLPQLKRSTNMLICGEDLGMVPHCVPEVMKQLGILSLEIERMPKDPKTEFFHPE